MAADSAKPADSASDSESTAEKEDKPSGDSEKASDSEKTDKPEGDKEDKGEKVADDATAVNKTEPVVAKKPLTFKTTLSLSKNDKVTVDFDADSLTAANARVQTLLVGYWHIVMNVHCDIIIIIIDKISTKFNSFKH